MLKLLRRSPLLSLLTLSACSQPESYSDQHFTTTTTTIVERPKTAEELRAELLQQEQATPSQYVQVVEGTYRRNLIDELVLEGQLVNGATLANFKDPVLAVTWYSKTETELETKRYPLYELLPAQGSKPFKLKTQAPGYVVSVRMTVTEATVVE